jgi:hypothetical protein
MIAGFAPELVMLSIGLRAATCCGVRRDSRPRITRQIEQILFLGCP